MATYKLQPTFTPNFYENSSWQAKTALVGLDEVGRGCLAGPVVTAAVTLKPYASHTLLQDSKLLTPKQRLEVYAWLQDNSTYAVSFLDHVAIDQINIYQATLVCMKRALMQLIAHTGTVPSTVLVDAMPLKLELLDTCVYYFNYGEQHSSSIAAASIIAKVTRDRLVTRLCPLFPGYTLSSHKGYSTPAHKQHVTKLGRTIIHRQTFLKDHL